MIEILGRRELVARIEHECNLCSTKIMKGEKYLRHVYKDAGLYSTKYHERCYKIVEKYLESCGEDEYSDQEVREWVYEEGLPYCEHCFDEINYSETDIENEALKLCETCKKDSEIVWSYASLELRLNLLKKSRKQFLKETPVCI